jgi:hypothetical protein
MPTVELSNEDITLLLEVLNQTTIQGREGAIRFLKVYHALENGLEESEESERDENHEDN